jgi:hypothetical protein
MKATINNTLATSVSTSGIPDLNLRWGKERMSQFLEHVFGRIRAVFQVDTSTSSTTESIDTLIVNSAVDFVGALSLTAAGGTNCHYMELRCLSHSFLT